MRPMVGVRTRRCTCPITQLRGECAAGHLIEEHPALVSPDVGVPWAYESAGPYRVQLWHESPARIAECDVSHCSGDLFAAVDLFVSRAMPPQAGWQAFLIDERFRLVLGWSASQFTLDRHGMPAWFGVEDAFEHLTPLVGDPMTVAIWESIAKGAAR